MTATSQALWFGTEAIRVGGLAAARVYDTLTFAGLSGPMPVTMHMTVDGSFFTTDPNPNTQGTELVGTLLVLGTGGSGIRIVQGNSGQAFVFSKEGAVTTNADPASLIFDSADVRFVLVSTFVVSPGAPSATFIALLRAASGLGFTAPSLTVKEGIVDFGHTAQFSLDVPDGINWSSASGVFLTGVAAPVPEPGAAWLLLTALVPLAARIRSARRREATSSSRRMPAIQGDPKR